MLCPNCGNQVQEGSNFCPYCSTNLTQNNSAGVPNQNYQQPVYQQPMGGRPIIKNRNVVLAIILSMVTCGIYGIYWFIVMTDESNSLVDKNKTAGGGTAFLFTV